MMSGDTLDVKRAKIETNDEHIASTAVPITCKFFVKRKKRYCRLTPSHGEEYCGEHMPVTNLSPDTIESNDLVINKSNARVPCPLDPKHTVRARKLHKHLKICNAIEKDRPCYIVPGMNAGNDINANDANKSDTKTEFKLTDIDKEIVDKIVEKIDNLYAAHKIDEKIDDLTASHPLLDTELNNKEYGHETLRHLIQTSTILGYLNHYKLIENNCSYIEYGAGKGQVSYWLSKTISNYPNSNVLLIDRASVRHKKDNKLDASHVVQRIRADIADFDISAHSLIQKSSKIVGLGKHLCGAATDFTIQCTIHGNNAVCRTGHGPKTVAMLIALCCHHRCEWKHFVGKEFFIQNNVTELEFAIMTKMVGWAICGTGMSREKRKQIEENNANEQIDDLIQVENEENAKINIATKRDRHQRKEIGEKCKRLIDYARICYLEQNGFKCSLKRYVSSDITLENICLVALHENQ